MMHHNELVKRVLQGFTRLIIALLLLLFLPAGTLRYSHGWIFLVAAVGYSAFLTLYLFRYDRVLLERRVNVGPSAETDPRQKRIAATLQALFGLILIVPALDYRWGWSDVPIAGVILGHVLLLLGFYGIWQVYRTNTFSAGAVQLAENHAVISTGPYALIRHPMYTSGIVLFAGTPLALDSYWGLVMVVPFIALLIWRLLDEERFLARELNGYAEYARSVKYRLVPFVW